MCLGAFGQNLQKEQTMFVMCLVSCVGAVPPFTFGAVIGQHITEIVEGPSAAVNSKNHKTVERPLTAVNFRRKTVEGRK